MTETAPDWILPADLNRVKVPEREDKGAEFEAGVEPCDFAQEAVAGKAEVSESEELDGGAGGKGEGSGSGPLDKIGNLFSPRIELVVVIESEDLKVPGIDD